MKAFRRRSSCLALVLVTLCVVGLGHADSPRPSTAPSVPKIGDKAPDFILEGLDGQSVRLSDVTGKGPVVLIVLRGWPGYQCPLCTRQVGEVIGTRGSTQRARERIL